jgi:hypothetical protein
MSPTTVRGPSHLLVQFDHVTPVQQTPTNHPQQPEEQPTMQPT